jgi:hypothetical protein
MEFKTGKNYTSNKIFINLKENNLSKLYNYKYEYFSYSYVL